VMHSRARSGWMVAAVASFGVAACFIDADDSEGAAVGVATDVGTAGRAVDAGARICTPGATQLCYGPGACDGAQVCELHGLSWGPCDCGGGDGGTGGQLSPPSGGGAPNEGGAAGAPAAAECDDGTLNGDESDVDCGGTDCASCPVGASCVVGSDCATAYCDASVCAAPSCSDAVQSGDETDVDCGGSTCPVCAGGMRCRTGADCASGSCTNDVCDAP